jgi:putative cell wall-binding protein
VRFTGADRYQTNLALALALRGSGDFPYDTSDPTSGGATTLAAAKTWWGAASCPRSVIVVAGDTFADALSAASLSDPLDRSSQPRLERVASADPGFDPIGGFGRVDTAYAPIIITPSARTGATTLGRTARVAVTDLAAGGCSTARQAIIVGGSRSVPTPVEAELVRVGYREVFRAAGADRYATAAKVASALGVGSGVPAGTACQDPDASDGAVQQGWYGNAVAEYRFSAGSCQLLPKAVVLADGVVGADALAAGWWTSYWQVPVLLTGPDGSLPPATRQALTTLAPSTIIVLGGTARIPDATKAEAARLAGPTSVAGRIGEGVARDRWALSVEMAKAFGGWFPSTTGAFPNDLVCVAASSGASGWPDALAAGPLCARLGAARAGSPPRALSPVTGPAAKGLSVGGLAGPHSAVPVLLVPVGGTLPGSVANFLTGVYPGANRCTALVVRTPCDDPGFAAVVGGAVSPAAQTALNQLLGGTPVVEGTPRITGGFVTRLDLRPVFETPSIPTSTLACFPSGSLSEVRWLSFTADADRRTFLAQLDLLREGVYANGPNLALCTNLPAGGAVTVTGVGPAGTYDRAHSFDLRPEARFSLSRPVGQAGFAATTPGGFRWSSGGTPKPTVSIQRGRASEPLTSGTLTLDFRVDDAAGTATVTGTATLSTFFTSGRPLTGPIVAEAWRSSSTWEIAGSAQIELGQELMVGGFRGTLNLEGGTPTTVTWTLDGVPTVSSVVAR